MSPVRMAWLLVLRCMRLGLDTVLADMARFPRTEPFFFFFCRRICSLEGASHIVYGL